MFSLLSLLRLICIILFVDNSIITYAENETLLETYRTVG